MTKTRDPGETRLAFFGNAPLADSALAELAAAGYAPRRIISQTPLSPAVAQELGRERWDAFVVASYGAILSPEILSLPGRGCLNIHPSLLPRLRGPSPIRSAILENEQETGVTIILLDEETDHGPILAQKKVPVPEWPPRGRDLDALLAREGARLLVQILPLWLSGEIDARPQNDDVATYCPRFKKEDGLLSLADDPSLNLRKIRAFEGWPVAYAFFERPGRSGALKRLRVQILEAHLESGRLVIDTVKPEGKREMPYADFLRSGAAPL